jgi:23S rRNA pseudouridine1911/1915/1917 synthase
MEKRKELKASIEGKKRIDVFLKENTGLSRAKIQRRIKEGEIYVNGSPAKSYNQKVKTGDAIEYIEETPAEYELKSADIPLDIIYEDKNMLVINKQPGLVVHPALGHNDDTLVNAVFGKYVKQEDFKNKTSRPGIVHRLDKDTSGAIIVAKNEEALDKLAELFKKKEIKKEYLCLVHGIIEEEGHLSTLINRDLRNRKKFTARMMQGKEAYTIFAPLERFYNTTLLSVKILTGRTHQIRVHMNYLRHNVLGDEIYGDKSRDFQLLTYLGYSKESYCDVIPRQMLHAHRLEFMNPFTNEEIKLVAMPPKDFTSLVDKLRRKYNEAVQ